MEPIDKIRELFVTAQGQESKITMLLEQILDQLDRRKQGTQIGRHRPEDYQALFLQTRFPEQPSDEHSVLTAIPLLYEGVSLWSHPLAQSNVVPPPTTLSMIAGALAARYNENASWDHYGMSASRAEVMAIAMLADLIGFDKATAGGVFTFGGTGCNLYAARIGIEKADPDAKYTGIRDRIHFFCSDVSHYSIKSCAIWTGIGLDNIRVIPSDDDNAMLIGELQAEIERSIAAGAKIGTLFATMGTTDAFGIDSLKEMVALRDRVEQRVGYRIHIHADAVIGWPYLTFKNDVEIAHLSASLQRELRTILAKILALNSADSVGIDFHKTGWAPYLCSALVVKDKRDLFLLEKIKRDMPYLYQDSGYQPGIFTLETTRPNYALKALVNMLVLGKAGFETLIVHLLTMADHLRDRLKASADIALLNRNNPAFVTDFRCYPRSKFDADGQWLFYKELRDQTTPEFTDSINRYNQAIAHCMQQQAQESGGPLISYTDCYRTSGERRPLVGLKSYPMSPFTTTNDMDELLRSVYAAKHQVDQRVAVQPSDAG